jgi:hypothetical protein
MKLPVIGDQQKAVPVLSGRMRLTSCWALALIAISAVLVLPGPRGFAAQPVAAVMRIDLQGSGFLTSEGSIADYTALSFLSEDLLASSVN